MLENEVRLLWQASKDLHDSIRVDRRYDPEAADDLLAICRHGTNKKVRFGALRSVLSANRAAYSSKVVVQLIGGGIKSC